MKSDEINNFSVRYLSHGKNNQTQTHTHTKGQLYLLNTGIMACDSKEKHWTITPNCIGWIPPMVEHSAITWGKVSGWGLYIPHSWCYFLPAEVCLFQSNPFISALIERIAFFVNTDFLTNAQKRIIRVLLDEIKQSAAINSLLLPLPQDPRLLKITQGILADFTKQRSQSEWANWAGISVRSLSRHFMAETGMSFSHWRQLAKVIASLENLAQGERICDIAYALGYSSVSTYISSFKSIYGITPNNYFISK